MGWKACCACSGIIVLFLVIHPAVCMTEGEFLDYISQTDLITNVIEIEYIESEWTPEIIWQTQDYTNAWIDIVGYNYTVSKDDIFYINQSPDNAAWVMFGLSHNVDMWNWGVSSLSGKIIDKSYNGQCVTVTLETTLVYYEAKLVCTDTWLGHFCHVVKTYYTDIEYFYESDCNPPGQYPAANNTNITFLVYNNTIAPKTVMSIPYVDYILGYRIDYLNESAQYFTNIMTVDRFNNGFPYGNITTASCNPIYDNNTLFSRLGDHILINSTNISGLELFAQTPYENYLVNYSVENGSIMMKLEKETVLSMVNVFLLLLLCLYLIRYHRK